MRYLCTCGELFHVRDEQRGQRVPCPSCGAHWRIPEAEHSTASSIVASDQTPPKSYRLGCFRALCWRTGETVSGLWGMLSHDLPRAIRHCPRNIRRHWTTICAVAAFVIAIGYPWLLGLPNLEYVFPLPVPRNGWWAVAGFCWIGVLVACVIGCLRELSKWRAADTAANPKRAVRYIKGAIVCLLLVLGGFLAHFPEAVGDGASGYLVQSIAFSGHLLPDGTVNPLPMGGHSWHIAGCPDMARLRRKYARTTTYGWAVARYHEFGDSLVPSFVEACRTCRAEQFVESIGWIEGNDGYHPRFEKLQVCRQRGFVHWLLATVLAAGASFAAVVYWVIVSRK